MDTLTQFASDQVLFPIAQLGLVIFVAYCFAQNRVLESRARKGGFNGSVTRGNESMATFYGMYAALTGIFVSLSLGSGYAEHHRVFFRRTRCGADRLRVSLQRVVSQ